uniref:beta strand repeat-containing protein n=1 Tax=Flavobacterium sp. TaxID=239 RepID=UPI0037C0980D
VNSAFQQGTATADGNLVLNKVSVSEFFAVTLNSNDKAVAQTAFNLVTSNPASVAVADAALAQAVAPTYTLTTSIETVPASGTLPLYAKVNGVINGGATDTFQTGDTINGSGATNRVDVTVANTTAAAPLVTVNNVDAVNFRTLAAQAVNAQLFTGVNTVRSTGSTNVLTVNNGAIASTYALENTVSGSTDGLAVGIRASDTTGTTTTAQFSVSNAGTASTAAAGLAANAVNSLLSTTATGIENISIATSGTNNIQFTGNTTATTDSVKLTLTGTGQNTVTLGAGGLATTATVDGSALTNALTLVVGNNLSTGDTFTGGQSTSDVLRINVAPAVATGVAVTGFETLRMTAGATASTIGFAANPGFATVQIDAVDGVAAAGVAYSLLSGGGFSNLNYRGDALTANVANAKTFNALTATGGWTGASDTLTIALSNGAQTITAANSYQVGALSVNGAETINITEADVTANQQAATFNGITSNTLTTLTASGTGNVAINGITAGSGTATGGTLQSINLSGITSTAASTIGAGAIGATTLAAASTITAGVGGLQVGTAANSGFGNVAGSEVLTFVGAAGADILNASTFGANTVVSATGGAGNDALIGGAGADSLNGGDGNDTVVGLGGADALVGGANDDEFRFFTGDIVAGETISGGTGTNTIRAMDGGADVDFTALTTATIGTAGLIQNIVIEDITANGAVFTGAQLSGQTININTSGNAGGAATLTVNVASGTTATVAALTFGAGYTAGVDLVTINGAAGNETITGTSFGATINGLAGTDTITGGAGADTIVGGADADTMSGAGGIDTFATGAIANFALGESVNGGDGVDILSFAAAGAITYVGRTVSSVETLTLTAGAANAVVVTQGTGLVTVNNLGVVNATWTLNNAGTVFDAAASANAAAVTAAGDWFLAAGADDNVLTYWDQVTSSAVAITLVGTETGALDAGIAVVNGNLVVTQA